MFINVKVVGNTPRPVAPSMRTDDTTIRQILEEAGVDYATSLVAVNGHNYRGADLDLALSQVLPAGVDNAFISCVKKTDNAASATITGSAVVVTSDVKREDLATIEKYRPKMLHLFEGEGDERQEVFCIGLNEETGWLGRNGAIFGKRTTDEGKATITMVLPNNVTDAKKYVEEQYGVSLLMLDKFEASVEAVLTEINNEKTKISEHITVA